MAITPEPKATGVGVQLTNVTMKFGTNTVLDDLDLELHPGELLALLGPSGCGKTTTLRILAGYESPTQGTVIINGADVTSRSVRSRGVGIVFQSYSLFPHMTAQENVAYGLRIRKVRSSARATQASELLDRVGLAQHASKYPNQLSGGQQQRVALARALAIQPAVLLLDEPLSALDAKVRVQLREQIRALQRENGTTTLLVTHDQEEALTMADRIGVMNAGRIEQLGTPEEVYRRPRTAFVSTFVGVVNRVPATMTGKNAVVFGKTMTVVNIDEPGVDSAQHALVRPEDIQLTQAGPDTAAGDVESHVLRGPITSVSVVPIGTEQPLRVDLPSHEAEQFPPGKRVGVLTRRSSVVMEPGHPDTPLATAPDKDA